MMKNILKQLWNQRKVNGWIATELLLVSIFLWVITDRMVFTYDSFTRPMGFEIEDTYRMYLDELSSTAPGFVEQTDEKNKENLQTILSRIRQIDGVEALSASSCAMPYSPCNSSHMFLAVHGNDSIVKSGMTRFVTPEYFKVFRILTPEGKFTGEANRYELVVSKDLADSLKVNRGDSIVSLGRDEHRAFVIELCTEVRYAEAWEDVKNAYTVVPENDLITERWPDELCIRFRSGMTDEQRTAVWDQIKSASLLNNYSFFYYKSFKDIRKDYLSSMTDQIKTECWYAFFLLANIFLGVIGTFWFRTQHRRSEIALRLAVGASRRSVFTQLIVEGVVLLSVIMPVVIIALVNIAYFDLLYPGVTIGRFLAGMLITWGLMALMIVAGIWYPARQAMKVHPAEALREE